MGADYYFRMGSTHSICQDYALAGESNGIVYAILSDGCSGKPKPEQPGSPYTDFGARFLTLSALRNLGDIAESKHPLIKIIADADAMRRQASLPSDSLDATLLMVAEKNGIISLTMTGDGVFVTRNRDGLVNYTYKEFEQGMPAYLNYQIKTSAQEDYLSHAKTYTETYGVKDKEGYTKDSEQMSNHSIQSSYSRLSLLREEIDLVLLFSDGIQSFVDSKTNQPVPFEQVLDVILDLPRMTGQFVTRSCNYLLKKHCLENGWVHHDDFSCAGIYLPE
jgi:serine/threonine protein phosphatase PrpC